MCGENKGLFLFFLTYAFLSCSQLVYSQKNGPHKYVEKAPVTLSVKAYIESVKNDREYRLVNLKSVAPSISLDLKYGTKANFAKRILYNHPKAYLRLPAAQALKEANDEFSDSGYVLKIFDAYRPYSVTKKMWELVRDHRYVANSAKGSGHNRGTSVDLTILEKSNGKEVTMPTPFDDFTEKASHSYMNLSPEIIVNRALLKRLMRKHGFTALPTEWWHYLYVGSSKKFELLDLSFDDLEKL